MIRTTEAEHPRDQKVRIVDGAFREFIGTLEHDDELETKVTVALSLFGRPVRLQVGRELVARL